MPFYALMKVTYHKLYQATLQRGFLAHCGYGIVAPDALQRKVDSPQHQWLGSEGRRTWNTFSMEQRQS